MGRTATKKVVEDVEENVKSEEVVVDKKSEDNEYLKIIKEMQKQMDSMKKQLDSVNVQEKPEKVLNGKRIKCINLMHNPLNVSTEQNGKGRVYSFNKYGDSLWIKYEDLADVYTSYPNTVESGCIFITNKDVIEVLDLTDKYKEIYTKEKIDELVYLRTDSDLDLFLGMNQEMQETTARRIAELINANERIEYNHIRKIKDETGIDLEQLANDLVEFRV